MRLLVGLVLGAALGFLAGRVGPQSELRSLREELTRREVELELARKRAARRGLTRLPGLTGLLATPGEGAQAPPDAADGEHGEPGPTSSGPDVADAPGGSDPSDASWEQAAAFLATRAAMMRSALVERAGLDEAGEAELDAAVAAFNEELGMAVEELRAVLDGQGFEDLPPREALRLASDLADIFYRGQVGVEEVVGPEVIMELDPEQQGVWNLIDPDVIAPVARR